MNFAPRKHVFTSVSASVAAIMMAVIAALNLAMLIPGVSPEARKA